MGWPTAGLPGHHRQRVRCLRLVLASKSCLLPAEETCLQDGPHLPGHTSEFFWHESRRYVCRLCTSHLRLVKEGEVNRPSRTKRKQTPNQTKTPNPNNQARHGSHLQRLREPEIGETYVCQEAMNSSLALSSSSSEWCTVHI